MIGIYVNTGLRKAPALLAIVSLSLSLLACGPDGGGGDDGPDTSKTFAIENLDLTPGTDIPDATVRMGIEPFADHSIHAIGMAQGWYDEVGISVEPDPFGSTVQPDQVVPRLTQNDLDVATWYVPSAVQSLDAMPDMRIFAFHDVSLGLNLLANPDLDAVSISELVEDGASFEDAAREAMGQLRGKKVAIGQDTSLNAYFNLLLKYADMKLSDLDVTSIDDNSQISLARGGKIDFVAPLGLAAMASVINLGWKPVARVNDLIDEFGADDPDVRTTLGNTGLVARADYVQDNPETILRITSVLFRIIDEINEDIDSAMEHVIPFLSSIAGLELDPEDLKLVYQELDPMLPVEDQTEYWDPQGQYYYKELYSAVLQDNVNAGVVTGDHDIDSAFVGSEVFDALMELKRMCDELLADEAAMEEADQDVVSAAEAQYDHRNYLDAYRMLKFALK